MHEPRIDRLRWIARWSKPNGARAACERNGTVRFWERPGGPAIQMTALESQDLGQVHQFWVNNGMTRDQGYD